MPSPEERSGLPALLGGIALFSTVEVASKQIGQRISPFEMVFIRFFVAGIVLLLISAPALRRIGPGLSRRDYSIFLLNGFLGVTMSLTLYHAAIIAFEKAASCAVVFSANPLFVLVLSRFINRESWSPAKWVSVLLGAAGVACFAWESGAFAAGALAAIGLMLAAAFFFAAGICVSRLVVRRYGAMVLAGFSSLFGSLLTLPLAAWSVARGGLGPIWEVWPQLAWIVLAATALAYVLYYFGLSRTPAFKASTTFFLKPVLATLLAVLLLNEQVNAFMAAGTLLILGGLLAVVLPGRILAGRRARRPGR